MTVKDYLKWDKATYKKRGLSRPATVYEAYFTLCAWNNEDHLKVVKDWLKR